MSRLAIFFGLLLSALAISSLCGCKGKGGPERHEVKGKVTFKKLPLNEGIIMFFAMDGQATGDGAAIRNGEYRIASAKGLHPGRYKVTIVGGDGSSGAGSDEPPGPGREPKRGSRKDIIPPEYNEKSTQIVEVKKDGLNQFDFDIP